MLVEVTATNSFMVSRPVVDPMGPEHRHAVLEPAGAVGDLGEIVAAEALLLGHEGAMVGRDHLERAGPQAVPQIVLVLLVAERRRHHPAGRMVPIRVLIFGLVEHEMLDQRLAIDPLAEAAGPRDRLVGRDEEVWTM